jgi:hypothetical protein
MPSAVEQLTFKAKAGVDISALIAASDAAGAAVQLQDGFVSRQLYIDPDTDEVVVLVHWRDLDAAKAATIAVMSHPHAQPFFQMIDEATMVMKHYIAVGAAVDVSSPVASPKKGF